MKRILEVFGVGIIITLVALIPSVLGEQETQDFNTKFFAIGLIRIDSHNYEINGFVFIGMNGDQVLSFDMINLKYDGTPIKITNPLPFLFYIEYNTID